MKKVSRRPGSRTRGRERALQALYQIDLAAAEPADALAHALTNNDEGEEPSDREGIEFAEDLVRGVVEHRTSIDELIERHSLHWRIDRMAKVDRNILRLAAFELLHRKDVPPKVVLNEAIELAKKFGSEESSSFINGVLDKIAGELGGKQS